MNEHAVSRIFRSTDRELWVVTAAHGSRHSGLVATTVSEASIVPEMPRVLVTLARQHFTWELVEASGAFVLHLIEEGQMGWFRRFGLQSGRDVDKLRGLSWRAGRGGAPVLTGAAAWLECRVENRMTTGDRTVYLADVIDAACRDEIKPLTINRLLETAAADVLDQMQQQRAEDAQRDAAAIGRWRQQQRSNEPRL